MKKTKLKVGDYFTFHDGGGVVCRIVVQLQGKEANPYVITYSIKTGNIMEECGLTNDDYLECEGFELHEP